MVNPAKRTSKLVAIDRFATSAVVVGEVTSLEHELWTTRKEDQRLRPRSLAANFSVYLGDDTVEAAALVAIAVLASGKLAEVAGRLGDDVVVQLEGDTTAVHPVSLQKHSIYAAAGVRTRVGR